MKEKKYTLDAWTEAYEAVQNQISYARSVWRDGDYVQLPENELDDDTQIKIKCYRAVLKEIEKLA